MTEYGIETKKILTDVGVRNIERESNLYTGVRYVGGLGGGTETIEMGFRPKYIHIYTIYEGGYTCQSESIVVDNGTTTNVTTSYIIYNFWDRYSLGTGLNTSVDAIYIYRDSTRQRSYSIDVTDTGIDLIVGIEGAAAPPINIHIYAIG